MRLFGLILVLSGSPLFAQSQESGFGNISLGSLPGNLTETRGAVEIDWSLGSVGLQIGANAASLGAENSAAAFRAILTRDLQWPVRLGLSVAYDTNDGVKNDAITLGFHGRYRTDWTTIEANLLLPSHINETGAFSFTIAGEQQIGNKLSIETMLYRLSTDSEDPDFYTISLGANYDLTDNLMIFAEGFQTRSDDFDINGNGTHLGLAYQVSPHAILRASLDSVRPDEGKALLGATVAVQFDFGGQTDRAQMFQTAIIPDRVWLGAFEQPVSSGGA